MQPWESLTLSDTTSSWSTLQLQESLNRNVSKSSSSAFPCHKICNIIYILYSDPVFLQRLVALLSGDISDKLIDRGVISLKEEWMK